MPNLIHKATGRVEDVAPEDVDRLLGSGDYEPAAGSRTVVATEEGVDPVAIPTSALDQYDAPIESSRAAADRRLDEFRQEEFVEGVGNRIKAGLEGAGSALTFGGSDILLDDEATRARKGTAGRIVGEIGGGIVGALAPGGQSTLARVLARTPAGLASRAGTAIGRSGGTVARATGYGVEGALVGAGSAVPELVLSDDPVTLERAASVLSSNALLGGGLGVGGSVIAKAAEKGVRRLASMADEYAAHLRTGTTGTADAAGELVEYRKAFDEANPWIVAEKGTHRKVLMNQKRAFGRLTDEPIGLNENPQRALDPLRREAKVLREVLDDREEIIAKLVKEDAKLADDLALEVATLPAGQKAQLTGKIGKRYGDWADVKVPRTGNVKLDVDEAQRFLSALEGGEVQGARMQALGKLEDVLTRNEALQESIVTAREAAKGGGGGFLDDAGGKVALGALGAIAGGPVGAAAAYMLPRFTEKAGAVLGSRFRAAAAEVIERSASVAREFFDASKRTMRVPPVAATKLLTAIRFGPEQHDGNTAPASSKLAEAFRAREREIRSQIAAGPRGRPRMTSAARERVAQQLRGVRAVSPQIADYLESTAARRLEFLASKLPRRPDLAAIQVGPDRWQPSEFQMRQFARYAAGVEDPTSIEERLLDGTVTPEDAEVLREVYPERYNQLRRELVERLPELRQSLPYERRLALSILFGVPIDPSMHPNVVAVLQASYAAEPGTEGGTVAPTATPAFGSISKPENTPAQERATGHSATS